MRTWLIAVLCVFVTGCNAGFNCFVDDARFLRQGEWADLCTGENNIDWDGRRENVAAVVTDHRNHVDLLPDIYEEED